VADNIVLAGDAARVIDPLTGGGLSDACLTGRLTGETVAECITTGDVSKKVLMRYDPA